MENKIELSIGLVIQMLGPSLLSLPFIIHDLGYGSAIIQFVVCWLFVFAALYYVVEASHYTKSTSCATLSERAIGKPIMKVTSVFYTIYYIGHCACLIQISSDSIISFTRNIFNKEFSKAATAAVVSFICIFFCLFKSTQFLHKIFTLSGLLILILIFSVLIYFAESWDSKKMCEFENDTEFYKIAAFTGNFGHQIKLFAKYFPTFQCMFQIHSFIPQLIQQIPGPPLPKKNYVQLQSRIAVSISSLAYIVIGFLSAVMFGNLNKVNLYDSFDPCYTPVVDLLYIAYSILLVVGVPVSFQPLKFGLLQLVKKTGFLWTLLLSIVFCTSCGVVAQIPSILTVYGLFSASAGFFICVLQPVLLWYFHSQTKAKYRFMDQIKFVQNEDAYENIQKLNEGQKYETAQEVNPMDDDLFINDIKIGRKVVCGIIIVLMGALYLWSFVQFGINLIQEIRVALKK
ncbi:Amino_acid transporter family protein [Hexamita inflata]|uniref:Amino acid transporter family protein n=1 Tax=Hexamita inflata TaxID=28002 RepID=A0AA86U3K0_9EUKA|nr:Amino acid transporter family protein [Hexamita inflata]CAI9952497.1 Amino acid transporter family protein [Hexamita inflata]